MSSIGVFGEGEIDGKPFHIYTLLSQTHLPTFSSSSSEASIDSGDDDLSLPQPLFLCPFTRFEVENFKRIKSDNRWLYKRSLNFPKIDSEVEVRQFGTSPHFPNIRSGVDPQFQHLLDNDFSFCKLPIAPLFWCNNISSPYDNCNLCKNQCTSGTSYYLCSTCGEMFHKECVEAPLEIKHPSFPFLSLQLYDSPYLDWKCTSCEGNIHGLAYISSTHKLKMHPFCAMKPIIILIDHPKRHLHSLTFFPKQNSLLCNVCGVIKEFIPTYVCARCVYVVHQDCIYFPYIIRISRHQHRISFTSSLPSGRLSCGVCRREIDNNCGAYSCNKCDDYFVHSRCALRKDLWDGEELEGVPEEAEIVVDPFERIADGIILHFSHDHHLKLEINKVYDDDKLCQACVLPVYEGDYYSCVDQCDFILHEACADSPLKKHHPLHRRPLSLIVVTSQYHYDTGYFFCKACYRVSCGFVYEDTTVDGVFRLDLRCASISEPFKYQGHDHPLFLALDPEEEKSVACQICGEESNYNGFRKLNCIECNFIICFRCATLPYKARYKHDKHLLTFRKEEEANDQSGWCDVCEKKIVYSSDGGFYSCDDYCCTTLHIDCLLGKDPYMKPGQPMANNREEIHIIRNKTMSRPFCHCRECYEDRCPYKVFYETNNMTLCSFNCLFLSVLGRIT